MKKFFSYDPEDGFKLHKTEEEAKARAEGCLYVCRDIAQDDGEWPDMVDHICWGSVKQGVKEKHITNDSYDFAIEDVGENNLVSGEKLEAIFYQDQNGTRWVYSEEACSSIGAPDSLVMEIGRAVLYVPNVELSGGVSPSARTVG